MTSSLDATGSGLVLSGNDASRLFVINGSGSLSLTGLTLTHGAAPTAAASGGAVFLDGAPNAGNFALTNGAITNSTASSATGIGAGGAIDAENGSTLTLRNDTFSGNRAGINATGLTPSFGGAIYIFGKLGQPATLTIVGGSFTGNQTGISTTVSSGSGGAVSAFRTNTATAGASTGALKPGAHASGGGIYNSGQLALVSDTVTGNVATAGAAGTTTTSEGGGLYTTNGIVFDSAPQPATLPAAARAALQRALAAPVRPDAPVAPAPATAKNTIIAANTADLGPDVFGPFVSGGYNLIGNPSIPGLTGTLQPTDKTGVAPQLGPLADNGGPRAGAPGATLPTLTERVLPGSPALDAVPAASCTDDAGAPLATDERSLVRPFGAGCEIGAYEASTLTFGGPLGSAGGGCSLAITFFSVGTAFALRTGSALNTLMSYLSIKGPAGTITAVPLVPRAGVPSTLSCMVPDPAALPSAMTATTVTVDAQVVASTNPAIGRLSTVRVVATRTATTETVTVSAINPNTTTGATLYTLTPFVQPQTFVVRVLPSGPFSLPR